MAAVPLQDLKVEIRHIRGDGDVVAVYSHRRLATGGPAIAVVDIWQFERGLITEGWEIIEPIHETAGHAISWELAGH